MAQPDAAIRGSGHFFLPLIDATMSCRLVLSSRDADSTRFNSNIHFNLLWSSVKHKPEDLAGGGGQPTRVKHGRYASDEAFALAPLARADSYGLPTMVA